MFTAADLFLRQVERRAYVTALVSTRQRDDALDIVQNAMTDWFQYYHDKPEQDWPALFYTVLHSRIRDWGRRQQRQQRWFGLGRANSDDTSPLDDQAESLFGSPEAQLEAEQARQQFLTRLAALPLRQKQAFLLRVWHQQDTASSAAAMGVSSGSVKTHLSRALRALDCTLEDAGVTP